MPRRRITREKLTGGLLVAAAIAVMNVTTYGLTLAAARLLAAAHLRFRPIIMTSMAFTLGVLPLAIATGAGSASQRAIVAS